MKKKILRFLTLSFSTVLTVSLQETFNMLCPYLPYYLLELELTSRTVNLEFIRTDYQPDSNTNVSDQPLKFLISH